ncbi:CpsD/CapB family tyrosine-protein kinase [Vibrio sp. VB16]|uniref:CpsD/CapB family tyrosine-protein kinase n=1 Tax=Vibrio sp. VB16 TaxID=2785746 RepID=UPI00189E61EE|nr:CpsD/CapB family tyrosine-protein kinase [Vibrio sp. VB16]UGA57717.1 CpsD/CapB family tyrosine-protein kinase [Vibrio sp. VB16]
MTIPAMHAEIEQIFIEAELADCRSLCITSCQSGEGVTSLAIALTERYLLAGYRTLIIDLNIHKPSFSVLELPSLEPNEFWLEHTSSAQCFTGVASPINPPAQLAYKRPGHLKKNIEEWSKQFDRIVIDTSPILNINKSNIPSQIVATACDRTILTVLAGVTNKHDVTQAMKLLNSSQIQLLGTVLNTKEQPSLLFELNREINRLAFLPRKWRSAITNKLKKNQFLSITV